MTSIRRALTVSALGAGISYANLAVALPLVVLAEGRTAFVAGVLLGLNTIAFSLGALLALPLRRTETGIVLGLATIAGGDVVLVFSSTNGWLAVGALVHGTGMGLFWVGVQAALGRRSGITGSQRAFVGQYAVYTFGGVLGGALTGGGIAVLRTLGAGNATSIRLTFAIGAAAVLGAIPPVTSWLRTVGAQALAWSRPAPLQGLALQLPDLLLVSAMGMLLNLAPVVLEQDFGFAPLSIGIVTGFIAAAKIAGSFTAGRVVLTVDSRNTVGAMLAASAVAAAVLVATQQAWLYVLLTVAATFFGIGVWPIVVDGALARVSPRQRPGLTIAWNVREYATIAATTALGGYLLDASARPTLLLALVAALLAAAAVSALTVLRRPVYAAQTT
jgi:MFS family permease